MTAKGEVLHCSARKNSKEITLGNGTKWSICAQDMGAAEILWQLSEIMNLKPCNGNSDKQLILQTGTNPKSMTAKSENANTIICHFNLFANPDMSIIIIIWLSMIIAKDAHDSGGFLLHGALAEYKGSGVIMAGPGCIGKTTASSRLGSPWKSISDDCSLVTCTQNGAYHAHPWPTWSKFMFEGKGGSWNVEYNIQLRAVFFLSRIPSKKPVPVSSSEAVAMMLKSSEQAWGQMLTRMEKDEVVKIRMQMFNNMCRAVKKIPCYILSLDSDFQEQMTSTMIK